MAHLAYFREEYVVRRRWLDEESYAELVALCQFLPGPASSQSGFGVGLLPWWRTLRGQPGAQAAPRRSLDGRAGLRRRRCSPSLTPP